MSSRPDNPTSDELDELLTELMLNCIDDSNVTTQNLIHFTNYGLDFNEAKQKLQKREKRLKIEADRKTLETIAVLLNGGYNQVAVVRGYIRNKLEMYQHQLATRAGDFEA